MKRICEHCGSDKGVRKYRQEMELCVKHYTQMWSRGKILKRTVFDPNDFHVKEDYVEVVLFNRCCNEVARAIIDTEDMKKVQEKKWGLKNGYVRSSDHVFLHHYVFGRKEDLIIDHINRDPLDNRKKNLRFATYRENMLNQGCRGYHWDKLNSKWVVQISIDGKNTTLGRFKDEADAKEARLRAEIKYYGKFCR